MWTAPDVWSPLAPDDPPPPSPGAGAAHARALLRRILRERLEPDAERVRIARTPAGRPYLPDVDWDFSLSYTSGLVAVAVAHRARIGIDVERVRPVEKARVIAERFFSPADRAVLDALDGAARPAYWFQTWTKVEALVKAHGTGLLDPPPGSAPTVRLPVPEGFAGTVAALDWNGGPG